MVQVVTHHQLMMAVTIVVGYLVYLMITVAVLCRKSDRERAAEKATKQALAVHATVSHPEVSDICSNF